MDTVSYYQYTHTSPVANTNYYRIMQRDLDGKYTISTVKQLTVSEGTPALQLTGNLVNSGQLQLRIYEPAMLQIIGSNGQVLMIKMMSIGTQSIDVSNYSSGIYHLRSGNNSIKFLLQ